MDSTVGQTVESEAVFSHFFGVAVDGACVFLYVMKCRSPVLLSCGYFFLWFACH